MSTIKTETLSTPSNATVPVDTVVNGTAKAWVNFNGTGTVAIRRAFNVSSITDNQTGDYTVNFITAMPNVDYSAVASGGAISGIGSRTAISCPNTPTTTSVGVTIVNTSSALVDVTFINVAVFS